MAEYRSKYTGAEVDALLDKVESGEVGGKVTVDSALSTESENPVMNKVITEELNKKLEGEVVGTTSPTVGTVGGSYDDTEIRQELTELSAEVSELELTQDYLNIKNVKPSVSGSYVDTSGNIVNDGTSYRTDYINVEGYVSIKGAAGCFAVGLILAFFDENKRYIADASIRGNSTNTIQYFDVEIPSSANYVIISNYGEANKEASYAILTQEEDLFERLEETSETIYGGTFGLIKGSYVGTNGTIVNDGNSYRTDFIAIDNFLRIQGKGSFYGIGLVLAFFDENKTFISDGSIRGNDGNTLKEFDSPIPSGAKYAVVSAYGATNANQSYLKTSGLVGMLKRDVHKNVLIFGDSITETKTITYASEADPYSLTYSTYSTNWVDYLKKEQNGIVKFNEIRNYAKSGARFIKVSSGQEARQFIGFQIDEAIADLNAPSDGYFYGKSFEPDIIVVSMGTNDFETASSTSYDDAMARSVIASGGYIDVDATIDNLRNSIFAESVRKAFMRIRKQFPLAKMYMCLPMQRAWQEFPEGILDCLRKMSARYGFTIIDCYGESGITRDFQSVYLRDGLHPNDKGKEVMGRYIVNRILADNHY